MAAPYYIIDTYAMTAAFMSQQSMARRRLSTKLILFVLEKWPYLLHHAFIAVGYPVIVVRSYEEIKPSLSDDKLFSFCRMTI